MFLLSAVWRVVAAILDAIWFVIFVVPSRFLRWISSLRIPVPPILVRRGVPGALVLIAGVATWIWFFGPRTLDAPPFDETQMLETRLSTGFARMPSNLVVQSWVLRLPEGTGKGSLLIGRHPDGNLPGFGRIISMSDVLDEPGLYVSVSDGNHFVYLARLTDPRIVRHERFDAMKFEVGFDTARGGVIAARAPFVPRGVMHVFEVQVRGVERVLLRVPFRRWPFVKSGRRYRVPGR